MYKDKKEKGARVKGTTRKNQISWWVLSSVRGWAEQKHTLPANVVWGWKPCNSQNTTNWIFSWHSFQTPYLQFFWYRFFWAQVTSPQGFLKLPFDAPPRHRVTVSPYDRLTYQMCKISGVPLYFGNQSGTVQKCRNMLQIHPVCGVPVAQCLCSSLICSIWLINSLPYAPLINVRHHIPCSEEDLWLDRWVKIHSKSSSELSL